MMRDSRLVLPAVLVLALSPVSCGKSAPAPAPAPATTVAPAAPAEPAETPAADTAAAAAPAAEAVTAAKKVVKVADFNDNRTMNLLQGRYSAFAKAPSMATINTVTDEKVGETGGSLKLNFTKGSEGWCGFWLRCAADGAYHNAADLTHLSFMVKGASGGETFDIGLSDETWHKKEDSVQAGNSLDFVKGGVTTSWQRVEVPITSAGLDLAKFNGFALTISSGKGTIFIDDIQLEAR